MSVPMQGKGATGTHKTQPHSQGAPVSWGEEGSASEVTEARLEAPQREKAKQMTVT